MTDKVSSEITTLNTLIATLIDSITGYEDAASNAEQSQFQQIFRERATSTPLIPPPTVELVQSLNGVRRAVVTSSVQVEIEPLLDRAGVLPYLDATVYGGDVIRLKPAPDPYLLAAQRTGARIPLVQSARCAAQGTRSRTAWSLAAFPHRTPHAGGSKGPSTCARMMASTRSCSTMLHRRGRDSRSEATRAAALVTRSRSRNR